MHDAPHRVHENMHGRNNAFCLTRSVLPPSGIVERLVGLSCCCRLGKKGYRTARRCNTATIKTVDSVDIITL